ncbi:MAG: chemotaxis protein CheA, partial [Robiginitomaculum sp.]|nr:chemotaxis protein CheA [Robiginitomaculum sp.]
ATIRINLERVDRLINLVGELVINQAMLTECVVDAGIAQDPSVSAGLDEFKQLTRDIQESVMAIRAQPVQPLFQRMSRIVRKAASATEKSVKLVLEGEYTEVDKTIVEKLADPLTHMIRNAVDHGIESPERRVAIGKPEEGIVTLSAAHRSGKIIIEVKDDGAGINRERVKQIAIEKNLIAEDATLSDNDIDNLLFMPGFSTVETVSTLSGRGVGMDVVKRAIQSIGGRVIITSTPGQGSTFTISLPLTLAILDGMLVTTAGQTLIVPLTAIVETMIPSPEDIHMVGKDSVINIRGTFVPLVDVGYELGFRDSPTDTQKCVVLSIITDDGVQSAIVVDKIQEQRQVVIKSLETNYGHVPCIAAATILGDGRIALILDVDYLIEQAGQNKSELDLPLIAAE